MNRLLLAIIGVLAVGVVAMIIVLLAGGGREPLTLPGSPVAQTDETGNGEATTAMAETDPAALALFDAWADPLRAAGFTIGADSVTTDGATLVVAGLDMAGPPYPVAWRWTASSVRIDTREDGGAAITPDGTMVLAVLDETNTPSWPMTADAVDLAVEHDGDGRVSAYIATFANLSMGDAATSEPITAAEASLRSAVDPSGSAAAATDGTLHLRDLVLPAQAGGPLGTTIHALDADFIAEGGRSGFGAPWRGEAGSLTLNTISLEWGALRFTGTGSLSIDGAGRPTGTLRVDITDVLMALDAFNAVLRFDRDMLADTYAALLLELGEAAEGGTLPFTIDITGGEIVLRGQAHSIDDIVLGTVSPIYTPLIVE